MCYSDTLQAEDDSCYTVDGYIGYLFDFCFQFYFVSMSGMLFITVNHPEEQNWC